MAHTSVVPGTPDEGPCGRRPLSRRAFAGLSAAAVAGSCDGTAAVVSAEAAGASVVGTGLSAGSGDGTAAVDTVFSPFWDDRAAVFFRLRRRRVPPFSPGGVVRFLSSCILYATLLFPSSLATQVQPFSLRLFII